MTLQEWDIPYKDLCRTWGKTPNPTQAAAYWDVLKNFPVSAIEQAIVKANTEAAYFPQPSKIHEHAHGVVAAAVYIPPDCQTCGGNKFVDGLDRVVYNRTYKTVRPCPVCNYRARSRGDRE